MKNKYQPFAQKNQMLPLKNTRKDHSPLPVSAPEKESEELPERGINIVDVSPSKQCKNEALKVLYKHTETILADDGVHQSIKIVPAMIEYAELYASQQTNGWISVEQEPNEEKEYGVLYKGGDVGKLSWWRGYWANGNVDVSNDITHYIELPNT